MNKLFPKSTTWVLNAIFWKNVKMFIQVNNELIFESILNLDVYLLELDNLNRLNKYRKLLLQIDGMTCYSCVNNIETNVKLMNGISQIEVNLQNKQGCIVYDNLLINQSDIVDKIECLGFDCAVISEAEASHVPYQDDSDNENSDTDVNGETNNFNTNIEIEPDKVRLVWHNNVFNLGMSLAQKVFYQHHWNDVCIMCGQH